ncbi:hypothetical protein ACT6NV_03060 [Robiginitalea sp. IMCC44478]|uniref:hypothetical protein n=1 Tax=Robiginitalea sp. IMCC44478 TaxID=3459122 RepID=UPI0040438220
MKKKLNHLRELSLRLIKNSTFINLFATTLGVLLAFYLDGLYESNVIKTKVDVAYSNIITELERNKQSVLEDQKNDTVIFVIDQIRKYDKFLKGEIIATPNTFGSIRDEINAIEVVDSLNLEEQTVKYFVNYSNLQFSISTLPNVAWEAAKTAEIANYLEYECLSAIIKIYELQDLFEAEEYKLLEYYSDEKYIQFYNTASISRGLRNQLLERYDEAIVKLKNCN